MESNQIILALAALAQQTRLDAFRLLVKHEPTGLPAGEIANELAVPHNTMSAHLAVLARAKLVSSKRESRSIIYRANLDALQKITLFLLQDCCRGKPEVCAPVIASLTPCCPPGKEKQRGRSRV